MKIGKFIVFEVENQKVKVKTLKKVRFQLKCGYIRGKITKCLNWYMDVKIVRKSPNATLTKLCSNKGHIITYIMVSFILAFSVVLVLCLSYELLYFRPFSC